jgi:hypothetical protein
VSKVRNFPECNCEQESAELPKKIHNAGNGSGTIATDNLHR